ncbi:MAG TPA: DUF5939 domain-containing protein, partial [Candidatus Xenobia bacterium]
LSRRLATLHDYVHLPEPVVQRFAQVVPGLADWDLCRINPMAFATRHGFSANEVVDLLVASTKAGIFDVEWNHVCPACGAIQMTRDSIDRLESSDMRCELCDLDVHVALDDEVEVAFTINSSVRQLAVDPFAHAMDYQRYFFSSSFERKPEVRQYIQSTLIDFVPLPPGRTGKIEATFEPDVTYRVVSLDSHAVIWLRPAEEGAHDVDVELLPEGLARTEYTVAPGRVNVHLHNGTHRKVAFSLMRIDWDHLMDLLERYPHQRHPFLSAKRLLNSQVFRDLFRVQTTEASLHLQLRSLTLLFTDLKGSTALYDRVGDLEAWRLIQDHFRVLSRVVREHSGAIIKTMGDAIMAAFSTPVDAVEAAIDMLAAMDELNRTSSQDVLGLKIGLHEGPAVAINADQRVDYFGQTVNIAARVQALADAGEIVMTDTLYRSVGVANILGRLDAVRSEMEAELKGVSQKTLVIRHARVPTGLRPPVAFVPTG